MGERDNPNLTIGSAVQYLHDPVVLFTSAADEALRVWCAKTGAMIELVQYSQSPRITAFAAMGREPVLVSQTYDETVVWSYKDRLVKREQWSGVFAGPVAIDSTCSIIATGVEGGVLLRSLTGGESTRSLQGHKLWVKSLAFSWDGCLLATGGVDKYVLVWDLENHACVARFQMSGDVYSLSASTKGLLAAGTPRRLHGDLHGGEIRIFDLGRAVLRRTIQCSAPIYTLAFSPDGEQLLSGDHDGGVAAWDPQTSAQLWYRKVSPSAILHISHLPNGRAFACGGWDKAVHVCNTSHGEKLASLLAFGHPDSMRPTYEWLTLTASGHCHGSDLGVEFYRMGRVTSFPEAGECIHDPDRVAALFSDLI